MRKFHIGCSGFQYARWADGAFYPKKPNLQFYAERIKSVEINSSFYRIPQPRTCAAWNTHTPDDFTFVLKGFQGITHRRRINHSEAMDEYLERFAETADYLGHKLVGVLWQFPPSFHATQENRDRLSYFMDKVHNRLPGNSFEFRHPSWLEAGTYFTIWDRGLTFVRHDHHHLHCMNVPHSRAEGMLYTRYHGPRGDCRGRYTREVMALDALFLEKRKKPVIAYFNNDVDVGAPYNAMELQHCLESLYSGRDLDLTRIPADHSIRTLAQEQLLVWSR